MYTYSYSNNNQYYKQTGCSEKITPMYQLFFLFLLGALILPACGGSPKDNDAATGSISFSLEPPDAHSASSGASPLMQAAMLSCETYGVTSVEALVYDENDVLIIQGGPWDCIAGEGIIDGVTAGTNRTVSVNLRDNSSAVVLTGSKSGITVIDGQRADIGILKLKRLGGEDFIQPEAVDDSATVTWRGTVTVLNSGAGSVLLNDKGSGLSVVTTPIAGPLYGSLALSSNGTFSYTHDGINATSDSFVYRVLDIFGNEDTATVTITINPMPNNAPVLSDTSVSPPSGLTTDAFTYSVQYTDQDGDSPGSSVVFIDNIAHTMALASGSASNGTYAFSTALGAGSHNYYFSFTDSKGGSARQPATGSIDGPTVTAPLCDANFTATPNSGDVPLTVKFADTSTGTVTAWAWNFGDGGTSTAQNPSHSYTTAGIFTVTLTITGPCGSKSKTYSVMATVCYAIAANFTATPNSGNGSLTVNFADTSTGTVTSWSWSFGDGATSTVRNPSHAYTRAGTYYVTLSATGPCGKNTMSVMISVEPGSMFVRPDGADTNNGTSWKDAVQTIQKAVDLANPGDEIWVVEGTYDISNTIEIAKPINIYGGFAGDETNRNERHGEGESIVNASFSGRCFYITSNATLDRMTITRNVNYSGGGIRCEGTSAQNISVIINSCTLWGNISDQGGGGISSAYCTIAISDCYLAENTGRYGGAISSFYSNVYIFQCNFEGNTTTGEDNGYGGAVYNYECPSVEITSTIFTGNRGIWGGGVANYKSSVTITSSVFFQNVAQDTYGGGICTLLGDVTITNCTFFENIASAGGGAISNLDLDTVPGASARITNCILWNDSGSDLFPEIHNRSSIPIVTYSNIENGYKGEGNINVDPFFEEWEGFYGELSADSPCINRGTNNAPALPLFDFFGGNRIIDSIVDLGACEYGSNLN